MQWVLSMLNACARKHRLPKLWRQARALLKPGKDPSSPKSFIVGENGHAFFNCDLHGVVKFSQVVGLVPWYLPLRFGRGAEVSPRWNLWGGAFPPRITNIFKKSHLCQFVMDSKDLHICRSAMTYTIFQK